MWATSVPILVFLGLSVLDLGPMYTTDVRQHHRLIPPPIRGGGIITRLDSTRWWPLLGDLGAVVCGVRVSQAARLGQPALARSSGDRQAGLVQSTTVLPAEGQAGQPDVIHVRLLRPRPSVRRTRVVVTGRSAHGPAVVSANHLLPAASLLWCRHSLVGVMPHYHLTQKCRL